MEIKKAIVFVGQCPVNNEDLVHYVQEYINDVPVDTEINVFDLPRVGGSDTGKYEGNVFVHRYSCPSDNIKDAVDRDREIVRDIVALGPIFCVIQTNVNAKLKPLISNIQRAMKQYGIKCYEK